MSEAALVQVQTGLPAHPAPDAEVEEFVRYATAASTSRRNFCPCFLISCGERLSLHGPAEWLGHGGIEIGEERLDPLLEVILGGEVAAA